MVELRDSTLDAASGRAGLALAPHPDGGSYRELWRDTPPDGSRGAASSIIFLLDDGESSRWHRVDAAEIWLWQAGASLRLRIGQDAVTLGPGPGDLLQAVVPAHQWQAADPRGGWTLVSCIVAPAFEFAGFELGAEGWAPPLSHNPRGSGA